MSFSIDNLNSSAISFALFLREVALVDRSSDCSILLSDIEPICWLTLGQVEKTQARDSKLFQQPFLKILLLHHRQLLCLHLPTVHRQLPIHLAPDLEHKLFWRMTR